MQNTTALLCRNLNKRSSTSTQRPSKASVFEMTSTIRKQCCRTVNFR